MSTDLPPQHQSGLDYADSRDRLLHPLPARREVQFSEIYFVLRRRRIFVLAWMAAGMLAALLLTTISHKRYSSTVTIQLLKEGDSAFGLDDLSGLSSQIISGDSMTVDLLTQQAVIGNENVALKVIQDLGLVNREPFRSLFPKGVSYPAGSSPLDIPEVREKAVKLFQSRLRVTVVKGTRLIDVTYTDPDPRQATAVANAVVEAYVIEVTQQRYDATSKTSRWLTNQISDLKSRVTDSQKRVNEFRQKTGLVGAPSLLDVQHGMGGEQNIDSVELDRLTDLNRQLTAAEVNRISDDAIYRLTDGGDAQAFLGLAAQSAPNASGGSLVDAANLDIGHLKQLRTAEDQVNVEIASETAKYGPKNPIIVALRRQSAELELQMRQEMTRLHSEAKQNLELATATEAALARSVEAEKRRIAQLNNNADQLLLLQQEEASNRALYESLYSKLEAADVLAGAKSSNVTIVNPARVPARPSYPRPIENLGLGLLAGLAVGVFGAFAKEYRNDSIATPEELSAASGIGLIGLVPLFGRQKRSRSGSDAVSRSDQARVDSPAWVIRAPRSATAEAYRQIRTAILLSRPSQPPKTILFASSLSGDGKTTSCFNTACAFALQGSRVLLVDADLRKPSLHSMLQMKNESGLSNCLSSHESPLSVVLQHSDLQSLHIMTAGPIPPDPSELLSSKRFGEVLRQLEENFDFVFIDAPPVLMVTDPVVMAQNVDGVVLVIRAGVTRRSFLRRALDLLASSRSKVLGAVLNAADVHSSEYNAAYGYYGDRSYYHESNE